METTRTNQSKGRRSRQARSKAKQGTVTQRKIELYQKSPSPQKAVKTEFSPNTKSNNKEIDTKSANPLDRLLNNNVHMASPSCFEGIFNKQFE